MAKHTSGPWTVVTGGPDQLTIAHRPGDGLGSHIARLDARWLCDEHGGTIEANARLIAAAPDLLESLARVEARLTAAARAFYGTGKRSALVNWHEIAVNLLSDVDTTTEDETDEVEAE